MLTKEQKQAIRDAVCQEFYKNGTTVFPDAIAAAIKVYDEQVNGKTNDKLPNKIDELKINKFTNAINAVQTLREAFNPTECQNFHIKRALTHLDLAKNDIWEHITVGEPDTRIEIKAFTIGTSKTKKFRGVYMKDGDTLCIELSE